MHNLTTNKGNVFEQENWRIFKRKKASKRGGLNQVFISDCLEKCDKIKDDADVSEIVKFIYDSRPTQEVEDLVLEDNRLQTQAITMSQSRGHISLGNQARFLTRLEKIGLLNREVEFLPDEKP